MTLLPDIDVWSLFFGGMFRKSAFVLALAVICLWRLLDASRKKMVWQVAFLCLMGIAVDESTGLSRGAAGWVNAVLAPDESPLPETGGIVSSLSSSVGTPSQLSIGLLAAPSADIDSRLLFRDIAMERIRVVDDALVSGFCGRLNCILLARDCSMASALLRWA